MHGGSEIYNYAFCILVLEVLTSTFLDGSALRTAT
jgi:hypothetical protein